ncbi:uncharacterized protein LOC105692497 [Athalia rosae]|uniref:uncharacterized protein LOC105692497 n=1 Tax=Athalia rosae TaxID=37344 RepID=UPI0020332592|nr:uncharacterized protein LOC105692497 [Athalia rosae]
MSMVTEHSGKGYAPLPQSMSNTDTENEDEDLGSPAYRLQKQSNQPLKLDGSAVMPENGRFHPLDETKNLANRLRNGRNTNNLGYCSDDIPIMVVDQDANDDLWKRPHMSFFRQLFLAASILLCIATILIFLYVIPCEDDDSPPLAIQNRPALLWEKSLQGIELHGPISVVPGTPYNLIFMYRDQQYGKAEPGSQSPKVGSEGGGVISVHGGKGLTLWWVPLSPVPTEIDCVSLDVDGSGKADCLVVGEHGLLASIEPIAGTRQWTSNVHTHSKLPVFLPDIDGDAIDDLLSVEVGEGSLGIALISGKNGHLLGRQLRPDCRRIHIYSIDLEGTVSYLCHDSNGKQSMKSLSLKDLFKGINYIQVKKKLAAKLKGLPNPFVIPERNPDHSTWVLTPFHQLSVERHGACPGDLCKSKMNITFQGITNESHSIWNSSGPNLYAMDPVILNQVDKPLITGFVMKFWQWNGQGSQLDKMNSSIISRSITERTLVVIINQTEVQAVNASQTEISQICNNADCQPSSKLQSQSLVVADLNEDGSRELISYQTSYEIDKFQVLKSKIQVVKLDSEVAKLTEVVIA